MIKLASLLKLREKFTEFVNFLACFGDFDLLCNDKITQKIHANFAENHNLLSQNYNGK